MESYDRKMDLILDGLKAMDAKTDRRFQELEDRLGARIDGLGRSLRTVVAGQAALEFRMDELVDLCKRHDSEILKIWAALRPPTRRPRGKHRE